MNGISLPVDDPMRAFIVRRRSLRRHLGEPSNSGLEEDKSVVAELSFWHSQNGNRDRLRGRSS